MPQPRILLLDNFDSFTYNLADYFGRLGANCHVVRNNIPFEEIISRDYDAVVLSPGPSEPMQAGCLMQIIGHYENRLPMLGICLGHQALGLHFGAKLRRAAKPMHGKISTIQTHLQNSKTLFVGLPPQIEVVRYHSLILEEIPECLRITASTADAEIMGFVHETLPIEGLQFHPEAILTQYGLEMLGHWLKRNVKPVTV